MCNKNNKKMIYRAHDLLHAGPYVTLDDNKGLTVCISFHIIIYYLFIFVQKCKL